MSTLFIPDKIRVGFQTRNDTYTGQLAYIIYYDKKGVLRKEKSWQTWRSDEIEPEEYDNKPQDGFVLNKGIRRYNWSHFSSNRSMIRIYDSRGIEFEVTPENLIGLLMETNCLKRGLEGEFVYAWCGPELVLLPCSSEAYVEAVKYTARQGKKISARDLKPGCSYTTKQGEEVIYMGRFLWFKWKYVDKGRISQKKHIFSYPTKPDDDDTRFFPKDASFLAELNSEDPVQNYAELVDEFNGDIHSSAIERWETTPLDPIADEVFATGKRHEWSTDEELKRTLYTKKDGDFIYFWHLAIVITYDRPRECDVVRGYDLERIGTLDLKSLRYSGEGRYYRYSRYRSDSRPAISRQQVLDKLITFEEVDMVLASGKKLRLHNIHDVAND